MKVLGLVLGIVVVFLYLSILFTPHKTSLPQRRVIDENTKNAVMALERLQTKCEVGINYSKYMDELSEANYAVHLVSKKVNQTLIDHTADKDDVSWVVSMELAIKYYQIVGALWKANLECKIKEPVRFKIREPDVSYLLMAYTEPRFISPTVRLCPEIDKENVTFDEAAQIVWAKAAEHVDFLLKETRMTVGIR